MDAARYEHVHAIFTKALALSEADRPAYLARACGGDQELRAEVESLLESSKKGSDEGNPFSDQKIEAARGQLEDRCAEVEDSTSSEPYKGSQWAPSRIGPYRIVKRIGMGGMGIVYEAEQDTPRRLVALKVLHPLFVTQDSVHRFRRESELLGRLQHPGIAQVFEAGAFDLGRGDQPFFAMELVHGSDIRTHCELDALDHSDRLHLLARVCDAVQHAHDRGIIHRDLKPQNILIDATGRPKVLDFGIARTTGSSTVLETMVTATGELMGTLAYMAPEQLAGDSASIGPGTDVYALGVIAFELLTERLPHDVSGLPVSGAIKIIVEEDVPRLGGIDPSLRGDVDLIVQKAVDKDRNRRYSSAAALAGDIRRYLDHLPVAARSPSRIYRFQRYYARKKAVVIGTTGTMATLLVGLVVTLILLFEARNARDENRDNLYCAELSRAGDAVEDFAGLTLVRETLDRWRPSSDSDDLRGWEWYWLSSRANSEDQVISLNTTPQSIAFSHDGHRVLVGMWKAVHAYDLKKNGKLLREFDHESDFVSTLTLLPGTGAFLTASSMINHDSLTRIRLWDLDSDAPLRVFGPPSDKPGALGPGAISPDGRFLAFPSERSCQVWNVETGTRIVTLPDIVGSCLAFDSDSSHLITGGDHGMTLHLWNTESWKIEKQLTTHAAIINSISWSPDGKLLASGSADTTLKLWDMATGQEILHLKGHQADVHAVAFSPNGELLASASSDHTIRVWNPKTGELHRELKGHTGRILAVSWHPNSHILASASDMDHSVRIWNTRAKTITQTWFADAGDVSPEYGRTVDLEWNKKELTSRKEGWTRTWDPDTGEELSIDNTRWITSPQNDLVAWGTEAQLGVRNRKSLTPIKIVEHGNLLASPISWNPAEDRILVSLLQESGSSLSVFSMSDGTLTPICEETTERVRGAWGPGGKTIARVFEDELTLLDVHSLREICTTRLNRGRIMDIAYSPDATYIAAATGLVDPSIKLFDAANLEEMKNLRGHTFDVNCVAFSPDGQRLASGSTDGAVKIWDAQAGKVVLSLPHESGVVAVCWNPDGSKIAALSKRARMRIWDASRGYRLEKER